MSSLHPAASKAAHFPWSLEFFVEGKKLLTDVYARHVQELFSVSCFTQPAELSREWVAVTVASTSSQEHVGKAKVKNRVPLPAACCV